MRCATRPGGTSGIACRHVSLTVDEQGMTFIACDPVGGRLIHIVITRGDMSRFSFRRSSAMHPVRFVRLKPGCRRCILESNSLHAVFRTGRRRVGSRPGDTN